MKKIIIFYILISSIAINALEKKIIPKNEYLGESIITLYNNTDKIFPTVVKKIEFFDNKHNLKKVEYYHNNKIINDKGITKQFQHYDEKQQVVKYELFFSPDRVNISNIDKVIEYVDENDKILKIEYFINQELVNTEKENFHYYPFQKLYYHDLIVKNRYKEHAKSNIKRDLIIIEGRITRGKAIVQFLNEIKNLSDEEIYFLEGIGKSKKDDELIKFYRTHYKRKILVKENDLKYWIYMQEQLFKHINKNQRMIIWYYFIGGLKNESVFISTGFDDL